ncbi:MAG: CBS domain-containing protein [Anaerolineales bacterium]|jgi:magnesium transporter
MPFISELIGRPVSDLDGEKVGELRDVLAASSTAMLHPKIIAIEVKGRRANTMVPIADVAVLIAPAIPLKKKWDEIVAYEPGSEDLFLVRDVLDKQIIDTNGVRVVRVNDLELTRVSGEFFVANVDISGAGLLRRLGVPLLSRRLAGRLQHRSPGGMISWDDVELIAGDQPMRLKVPGEKISDLHPADLAEILSDLTRQESSKLLDALDVKTLASTLEEVEPEFQASLIQQMPDERVADVLEEMSPDEAADLLAELPEDRSQELLRLMEDDEAEDVIMLLAYPEDSAGGIMNTEFIAVKPEMSAEEVLAVLRRDAEEAETIYYIYVQDSDGRLVGIFSLRELVLSKPDTPVSDFMETRVVTVDLEDSQEECAQVISKYNLLAVPVVDPVGRMQGIVTADDALDKIIPTAWKKRLPRMYR